MLCLLFWKRVRDIKTIILDVFHDRLVYATFLNLDSCCMLVGLQQCYVKFTGAAVSRCLIATSDVLQPSVILHCVPIKTVVPNFGDNFVKS